MKIRQGILVIFVSIVILMSFIFVVTQPNQSNYFKSDFIGQLTQSDTITDTLLLMMSTEIPTLKANLEENDIEPPNLSHVLFKVTSGITPSNFTSLLEVELPGLKSYAHGINISRSGDDVASMPIESPPPDFDKLLEEDKDKPEEDQPESDKDTDSTGPKQVFIYHSHAWEAFFPLMGKKGKLSEASSTDNKENVFYVGSILANNLKDAGINTAHDTTNVTAGLHAKGWDYYDAYRFSRETVEKAMASNKSLNYFIDIHRDAQRKDVTTTDIKGKKYAKLFFIVGVAHEGYEENLQFAKDLNDKIEERYPGISRGIFKKDQSEGDGVYNQDLSNRSIVIEVGGVDNDSKELQNTADALADVLSEYIKDAKKVNG
ncbi:stage II sporulation protein P [Lentibacillus sp. L22]|uniref:stage II sporulation protein P n=1 Tax=Lentibacillus TaxID=175304 RepID=UPI0022B08FC6|nr:stage II sporulation protein P [Lentibacillus daqui]